jgi:hypothetical protein
MIESRTKGMRPMAATSPDPNLIAKAILKKHGMKVHRDVDTSRADAIYYCSTLQ